MFFVNFFMYQLKLASPNAAKKTGKQERALRQGGR